MPDASCKRSGSALVRFGNIAIEWDRVYAVGAMSYARGSIPARVSLWTDLPALKPHSLFDSSTAPTVTVDHPYALAAWQRTESDPRLTRVGRSIHLAIDYAKVCQIVRTVKPPACLIQFRLGRDRFAALPVPAALSEDLLSMVTQPGDE